MLKYYGLDPCHYFSAPGLSWNAMLKTTGIELEKISDTDKYLFIEKGLRGGIPYIPSLLKDIVNQIMSIVQIMIKINHQHLFHTLT